MYLHRHFLSGIQNKTPFIFFCFKCISISKVVSSRLVYYSIFEHLGGATNQDMILTEMCYLLLPCTASNQIDHPKLWIKGCTNEVIFCKIHSKMELKFIYPEKATNFCEISTVDLSYVVTVKSPVEISQNFVAFSEYMNFTRSCEIFDPLNLKFVKSPSNKNSGRKR